MDNFAQNSALVEVDCGQMSVILHGARPHLQRLKRWMLLLVTPPFHATILQDAIHRPPLARIAKAERERESE